MSANRFERLGTWQRLAVIACACLAVITVLFALAEGAVRVRAWLKHGEPAVRVEDLYRYDERVGLRLPTAGYKSSRLTTNSLGFRGPEIPRDKPDGTYRVAFLGGSTTFCAEVSGNDKTWPYLVVNALKSAYPDRSFDYINAGVPGYTSETSRKRYEAEVVALRPDLVVIYHATNDLISISRGIAKNRGLDSDVLEGNLTWLSDRSMLSYLVEKNLRILWQRRDANDTTNKLDVDPAVLAAPFDQHLRDLVDSVQASGVTVALVSFSIHLRRDQTPENKWAAANTALYYMHYMTPDGLLDAFDAYNQTIRDIAQEKDAHLVDAAMAIPGDDRHFTDSVHFTDLGAQAMATAVSDSLVPMVGRLASHPQ